MGEQGRILPKRVGAHGAGGSVSKRWAAPVWYRAVSCPAVVLGSMGKQILPGLACPLSHGGGAMPPQGCGRAAHATIPSTHVEHFLLTNLNMRCIKKCSAFLFPSSLC